jgi:hypothetical protein
LTLIKLAHISGRGYDDFVTIFMRHWIFSYGPLAHRKVTERTGKTLDRVPAVLRDYIRNFRVLFEDSGFAGAGIAEKKGGRTVGMLVEVPESELPKFDELASYYVRLPLSPSLLSVVEGSMPEGNFYLYIPKLAESPTEASPISQSYLDVILSAYLDIDEALARRVAETMTDLEYYWLNDRKIPRYPHAIEGVDLRKVDALLGAVMPNQFRKRKDDPQAIQIRPELVESILKTIAFFDLFDFPLSAEEVLDYLYQYDRPVHIREVEATLKVLSERDGRLSGLKGYYVLPGREAIIETRKTRKFIAEKFWTRTKLYGTYMKNVPFVEMIAVCNNLAYDNPSEQSDIDLFIVVKPGRMWLARLLITLILQFYGVRRYGDKIAGRFCLSFFVTSEKLRMREFELRPEDPYLAYWTKNLRPIYGERTYLRFREENERWLNHYGLRFGTQYKTHMYHETGSRTKRFWEWFFGGAFGDLCEGLLKKTLKKRTLRKMQMLGTEAEVIVTDEILKFHNHDRRKEYFEAWKKQLS